MVGWKVIFNELEKVKFVYYQTLPVGRQGNECSAGPLRLSYSEASKIGLNTRYFESV